MFKMSEKSIRWSLVFLGSVILSEVAYQFYNYFKKDQKNSPKVVSDVIFTNELSSGCCLMQRNRLCTNEYCIYSNVQRVINAIDQATKTIDLAMYIITLSEVTSALTSAIKRKVVVRIISDWEMENASSSQIKLLEDAGALVRFPLLKNDDKMHHKFCIIDGGTKKAFLLNGSLNWTNQGFRCNYENITFLSDRKIVSKFQNEFQRMWIKFGEKGNNNQKVK